MKRKSKARCIMMLIPVFFLATMSLAAPERDESATQVAKAWFTSLMQGETEVTTTLSAVPFSFDRNHEIETLAELKEIYNGVVEKKGKRDLKIASAKIEESTPEKVTISITIEGDDEKVLVFVRPGEEFKVIGFSD